MPDALLEFDPTSEDAANSPLSVWNTASYMVTAFNPDAANQSVQWASSVDTEGALPASVKDENRTISMTIECLSAAALRALQAKAAKIGRERGTLKYTLPNSEVVIFDLLARESFKPEFDVKYFIHSGAYCTVTLGFTAKPYGRGPSTSLTISPSTGTANQPLIATATGVKGDVFANGHLTITNPAATYRSYAKWGVESRYYSSASTAALFFEAESGTAIGAALNAGPANSSGGGANKTMRHASVSTLGSRSYRVTASGSDLTHVGDFAVIARVQADSANTGTISVRLRWSLGKVTTSSIAAPTPYTDNSWVPIASDAGSPIEGSYVLVNLGLVSIPRTRLGTHVWTAETWAASTVSTDTVYWDWLTLVPVAEGSGEMRRLDPFYTSATVDITDEDCLIQDGSYAREAEVYEGDYFKIPPAGAEARTLRLAAILAGYAASDTAAGDLVSATTLDAIPVAVSYTPRYLVVPSP